MRTLKPLLALFVIVCLLTGCQFLLPEPEGPGLISSTVYLTGELTAQVQVRSSGYWEVSSREDWLDVSPTSGFGDAALHLTVDPDGLAPGEHATTLALSRIGTEVEYVQVIFAFPKLRGTIVRGTAPAASGLTLQSVPSIRDEPGRLLVGLQTDVDGVRSLSTDQQRTLASDVASMGGAQLVKVTPLGTAAVLKAGNMRLTADRLKDDPRVRYVEPDYELDLLSNDPEWDNQWAPRMINADDAWTVNDASGVQIAILDNGFHPNHPDLEQMVVSFGDLVGGSTSNCGTHGTHVTGIAGAEVDNTEGIAGVAKGAGLVLYNVGFEQNGQCVVSVSAAVEAIDQIVAENEVEVINMSFGGSFYSQTMYEAVVRAYEAGIVSVAAAGNDPTQPVLYPAAYPQVVAVSATNILDEAAYYSASGPEVFVSAPGGDDWDPILSTTNSTGYGYMMGTSMASPAVAATAALVLSTNPTLSPFQVSAILADTSVDLGTEGRDDYFGYGRIDALAAVIAASSPSPAPDWFLLRTPTAEFPVTEESPFTGGYVSPGMFFEIGSDDNGNGNLQDGGEYYGSVTIPADPFGDRYFDVVFHVEPQ